MIIALTGPKPKRLVPRGRPFATGRNGSTGDRSAQYWVAFL